MADKGGREKRWDINPPRYAIIESLVPLLNSMFRTAEFDIEIDALCFYKEEVVIGSPQIENLENELKEIKRTDEFELAGRYLALITIKSDNRTIPNYVRFYLTSEGKLYIEDTNDDGSTLANKDEFNTPTIWRKVIKYAEPFAVIIVKLILKMYGIAPDDV